MSAGEKVKPLWADYAAEVIPRLAAHGASPTTAVVALLGYAVENDDVGVDEFERSMAESWLNRLVDADGNPKDDRGYDPLEAGAIENTISQHGSYTRVYNDDGGGVFGPRIVFEFTVSRRVAEVHRDDVLTRKISEHFALQAQRLIDELYDLTPDEDEGDA